MSDTRHFRHFLHFRFQGMQSKPLVFVDRMYIRHFRHFRQPPCSSLEGAKTPFAKKKTRLRPPKLRL